FIRRGRTAALPVPRAETPAPLRGLSLGPGTLRRRRSRLFGGMPIARLAAALFEQPDIADDHAAVDRLAHVVDRQQADLHGGERLHLDAGRPERLGLGDA